MAARRAQPVQRSRSQGLRGNRDACRPRRGVVGPSYGSFASGQARKLIPSAGPLLPSRHCDSRAEVARQSRRSFFPARFIRHRRRFAGKLSPPNPLRSRWRLCRLTDAACPLRVLRWASAGAPVTASASQWGGRQCAVGLRPVRTAHRRREPRVQGPQVLVVFPPLLTAKAVPRPGRPAPAQARPPGDIPMDIGRPQVAPTGGQSLTLANRGRLRAWRLPYRPVGGASGMPRPTSGSGSPCGG